MTERPRELSDFKEVGQFEAKFWLKGYVSRFAPISMTFRWRVGECLYYNFTAGRLHIKNLCSRLYSTEVDFY